MPAIDLHHLASLSGAGQAGAELDKAGCYRLPKPGETGVWAVGLAIKITCFTEITVRAEDEVDARRLARALAKEHAEMLAGDADHQHVRVETDTVRPGNPAEVFEDQ